MRNIVRKMFDNVQIQDVDISYNIGQGDNMLEYEGIILPKQFEKVNDGFCNLTRKEAKDFCDWYISIIPERVNYLKYYLDILKCSFELDYTPHSLVLIWRFFLHHMQYSEFSQDEFNHYYRFVEEDIRQYIDKHYFSYQTQYFSNDIAMYFGEVARKNINGIYWGVFHGSKKIYNVNEPVLIGFPNKVTMNPRNIILTAMHRGVQNPDENQLLNFFNQWAKKIQ